MIGAPTGPCSPRPVSPGMRSSTILNASFTSSAQESPAHARAASPTKYWQEFTSVQVPPENSWKREARVCVHADTNNNVAIYPNYVFDPDGEIVPAARPNTFDLTGLIGKEPDGINFAGQATGILVATDGVKNGCVRLGTFFQVSPSRAVACFRTTTVHNDPRKRLRDLWVSKVCFIQHWDALFTNPKCRAKYFRRARIIPGFEEEREKLIASFSDRNSVFGLSPPFPSDFLLIELPNDFHNDPYLKPLPKNKFKTIKKIGVIAYNQKETRNEDRRNDIYYCTNGVPTYDNESRVMHFGNKSLSPGVLVGFTECYVIYENTLLDGSAGAPLVSLTRPHYFWGVQVCAFSDVETYQPNKSRNFNVSLSFYHPVFATLYVKFVLDTLPAGEAEQIRADCLSE